MTIGEKIKEVRKEKGLTQEQLGERCGVTRQYITRYENDLREPKINTLNKIASGLDVPLIELLKDTRYETILNNKQ